MKKVITIIVVLIMVQLSYTQDMIFHKKDNTKLNVPLGQVDSMTFAETLPAGSPCPETPTVTYSGKTYNTVLIGQQCWLKENLDVGIAIGGSINQSNNGIIEKYCYNNDISNCNTYGGLYQWNEAMQYVASGNNVQGICPSGWHISNNADFSILMGFVKGNGNELKAIGQGSGQGIGTDKTGFSGLFSGHRASDGSFLYIGWAGYFWRSKDWDSNSGESTAIYNATSSIYQYDYPKTNGYSIRCVKD